MRTQYIGDFQKGLKLYSTMDVKGALAVAVNRLGFLDAYAFLRTLLKSQVAILLYHRVSPKKDNWSFQPLSPQTFK